jgi:hypothetical protein
MGNLPRIDAHLGGQALLCPSRTNYDWSLDTLLVRVWPRDYYETTNFVDPILVFPPRRFSCRMAEQLLYQNNAEPLFPFGLLRPHLTWLSEYLSTHISGELYDLDEPLLNTVLVFGRARTSALLHMGNWTRVKALTKRLNSAARAAGAVHHILELDRVAGRGSFFVTCRHSPRYQWSRPMSHYQVGQNLDYFAPGHISMDSGRERCFVAFVNTISLRCLTGEVVFQDALNDPHVRNELHQYNKVRETILNSTMQQFGLTYRFKCVLHTADILENVAATLATNQPPAPEWWAANCYFVNGISFPGVNVDPSYSFCGFHTKYDQHWPLICKTFHFVLGHNRYEYNPSRVTYWEAMDSLLRHIKSVCEVDAEDVDDYAGVLDDIEVRFDNLTMLAPSMTSCPVQQSDEIARRQTETITSNSRIRRGLRHLNKKYHYIVRVVRLHVFERFKLQPRITRTSVEFPQSGNDIVFH